MSIRVLAVVVFCLLILPYMVVLRSARADSACDKISQAFYLIAKERDKGRAPDELYRQFMTLRDEGRITDQYLGILASWIITIYSSELSAEELQSFAKRTCLKSSNKMEI